MESKNIKDVYVMHLPQMPDNNVSVDLWLSELPAAERLPGKKIPCPDHRCQIAEAIHITNEEKRVLQKLLDLNQQQPVLISGMDMVENYLPNRLPSGP